MVRTMLFASALFTIAPGAFPDRLAAQQRSAYEELQTFSQVLNYIYHSYPDSTSYSALVRSAIDGVLRSLDPHSYFESRLDFERFNRLDRGELAITGMALEDVDSIPTVLALYPKGPADRAGVEAGDRVAAINDTVVAGLDIQTVRLRLAGEDNSKVRVKFFRGPRLEPDSFTVTMKRGFLKARYVSSAQMADSITGYVRLEEFSGKPAEVHDAVKGLIKKGARQMILDLRGNPGGSVVYAVELVSEFVPKNTVVFTARGRRRDVDTAYVTKRDGDFRDIPLVVLIDDHSASAAEATAASLQDHDRALLIGRRSFGKALEQVPFFLNSGDVLMMTVGHIVSPSGRVIQRQYHGLAVEQYYAFMGKSGAEQDTAQTFHTDAGRLVRGGGGVVPDIVVPRAASFPVWWSVAVDSGFEASVADSVANTLPATTAGREAWMGARADWSARLLPPFLNRVRSRFHIAAQTDSLLDRLLAANLAYEVALVRWGPDAGEEFVLRNSADIRVALENFPKIRALLSSPPK